MPSKEFGSFLSGEMVVIIGTHGIKGWAEGVFFNIRQITDNVSDSEGAGGETGVVINNSSKFEVDITLLQTSNDNLVLSLLHRATMTTGAVYPLQVEDPTGTTTGKSASSLFRKFPDAGFNKEGVETRTWTLFVPHFEYILGGNAS